MNATFNDSTAFNDAGPEEYLIENHGIIRSLVKLAFEKNEITPTCYDHLMLTVIDAETWEEAFDQIEALYKQLLEFMTNIDYYRLLERLEKGEQLIEVTTDPQLKTKYFQHYESLKADLERVMQERGIGA